MGIVHVPDSAWAQEASKWEARSTAFGEPKRPYEKRDYPMHLHLATARPEGGPPILTWEEAPDEATRERLWHRGFRDTPLEALAQLEAQQREYGELAAEREYDVRHRLSKNPRAIAEIRAHEAATADHLPSIPETPIKPRGRPKKAKAE
jgi:hypothetical protein